MGTDTAFSPVVLTAPASGRLPAQVKIVALVGFVCAVVATPPLTLWPYLAQCALLLLVAAVARLNLVRLVRGLAIELPFVAFALAMPFVATGERIVVAGLSLSVPGLWGAGTLLAKSTLGVLAALVLAATTSRTEFVAGLARLHLPDLVVEMLGLMLRYLDLIAEQWHRMAIARTSRGFRAADPRSWRLLSGMLAVGFIRTYERGERVHLAMLSRGYTGAFPTAVTGARPADARSWGAAVAVVGAAAAVTATAWVTR